MSHYMDDYKQILNEITTLESDIRQNHFLVEFLGELDALEVEINRKMIEVT